jgi:hypothetical protein
VARRCFRVVESSRFLGWLETDPPSFIVVVLKYGYPILSLAPDETSGSFLATYDPPFFSIEPQARVAGGA